MPVPGTRLRIKTLVLDLLCSVLLQVFVEDYNDHCPFLKEVNIDLDLEPIPPLRKEAFFTAIATDKDSGVNARITYNVSEPERVYVQCSLDTEVFYTDTVD